MTKQRFALSPCYLQSAAGLRKLHALAMAKREDSPEADAIRDSLSDPWLCLTETEKKRLTGLSEDFYSISEPAAETVPMNPQAQRKLGEAFLASRTGDWDSALDLLRRWGQCLEPAQLSFLRGVIWSEAGEPGTAYLFFEHASRLDAGNESYAYAALDALAKSDRVTAQVQSNEVLADADARPPSLVVKAAEIQFAAARNLPAIDARPVLEKLASILERNLERLRIGGAGEIAAPETPSARNLALLAFCHDYSGDFRTALEYYNLAVEANPENVDLLLARGVLRYASDPAAIHDFEVAIREGSTSVWPFFYLAHHNLVANNFDACRKLCERALETFAPDVVKATLYEWLAVSQSELGFPERPVRDAFEEALRHDPENERIKRNLQAFDQSAKQQPPRSPAWEKPSSSVIRALSQAGISTPVAA